MEDKTFTELLFKLYVIICFVLFECHLKMCYKIQRKNNVTDMIAFAIIFTTAINKQ